MAKLHKVKVKGEEHPQPFLWDKMSSFLELVPDVFSDSKKNERYRECIMSKAQIEGELRELRNALKNSDSPVVFAHNDLLLGNVIYTQSEDSVTFIDFEYAAFSYQAYDIGNHFAEFVGIGADLDYSLYPDKELQTDWIRTYLAEYHGREPKEEEVEKLYVQANQFVLAAHLFWGIWALIQAEHSYIDFEYMEYADLRLREYFAKKSVCALFNGSS
uniref:ethanolamine kinase n=1 Tax=Anoplophora glabripennis TaxID=217634 RepID=V5GUQ1_ANOGL